MNQPKQPQQPPKTRQNAFLVAFTTDKDGKLSVNTDVAPSEIVVQGNAPIGLKIFVNGTEIYFPNDKVERLIAYDKTQPTSVRFITIRKHRIFQAYQEYALRLKSRADEIKEELTLVTSIRSQLKEVIEKDPTIKELEQLFKNN